MVYDNCFSNKWLLDTKWYIVTGRFYALLWVGVYSGYWRKCSSAWLVVSPQSFIPRDWLKWNPRNVGTYLMFFFLQKYWCVFHHGRTINHVLKMCRSKHVIPRTRSNASHFFIQLQDLRPQKMWVRYQAAFPMTMFTDSVDIGLNYISSQLKL